MATALRTWPIASARSVAQCSGSQNRDVARRSEAQYRWCESRSSKQAVAVPKRGSGSLVCSAGEERYGIAFVPETLQLGRAQALFVQVGACSARAGVRRQVTDLIG